MAKGILLGRNIAIRAGHVHPLVVLAGLLWERTSVSPRELVLELPLLLLLLLSTIRALRELRVGELSLRALELGVLELALSPRELPLRPGKLWILRILVLTAGRKSLRVVILGIVLGVAVLRLVRAGQSDPKRYDGPHSPRNKMAHL